jgi:hypothetical protein
MGPDAVHPSNRDRRPLKHTLRPLFALLAAALAFACVGMGHGAGDRRGVDLRASAGRYEHRTEKAAYPRPSAGRVLLRGTGVLLDASRRTGAPPRMVAGTDPSHEDSFAMRAVHRRATGAHARRILSLAMARRLAAARDGTLSSHSNGVPPPASA